MSFHCHFKARFSAATKLSLDALCVAAIAAAACTTASVAQASITSTNWTNWTTASTLGASAANTVGGTLNMDGSAVQVTYTGATDRVELSGADWWGVSGTPDPYAATGAPNKRDIIRLVGGDSSTYKLTFSAAVLNPILAFLSVGTPSQQVNYQFDQSPTLLGSGVGWWGGCSTCLFVNGNTVSGTEGHGIVQFKGSFTELNWTAPNAEYWQGFTVGAGSVSVVPVPSSYLLMASGLAFVSFLTRRLKR